ncbi:4'-phosphopantetheinyl transferase family protein [Pseudarthrobacter sp. 1C304]|uniref:4'-phosphopantetheinyl transferase family protein n=1 Tax=Pseudarthrobacter sp. 1C304 TaxID=3457438 RepID=UPI003FD2012C
MAGITVRSVRLADVGPDGEAFLDAAEHSRAAGIRDSAARREFLAGRIALRDFAAVVLGVQPSDLTAASACPDCGSGPEIDHGRPGYLLAGAPTGVFLSLSRSRGWALLAAGSGAAVGVDLEHMSGVGFAGFDDVVLTPGERELLAAVPPEQAPSWRASAWARKEALLKAHGTGLRTDPATVEAFADFPDSTRLMDLDPAELGLPPEFAAALAVLGGT